MTRIYIANDHAAVSMAQAAKRHVTLLGYDVRYLGTASTDSVDYPHYAATLVRQLAAHQDAVGILLCGSGVGMSMAANRHPDMRAALCHTVEVAQLTRQHNNANIMCLGARLVDEKTNLAIIDAFLNTPFEGGRHNDRLNQF